MATDTKTILSNAHIWNTHDIVNILSNAEIVAPNTITSDAQITGLLTIASDSIIKSVGSIEQHLQVNQSTDDVTRFI